MHESVYLGSVWHTGLLLDGEGIDVGPEANDRTPESDFDKQADAVGADPGFEAVRFECFGDAIRGPTLGPGDLRMAVQIAPHSDGIGSDCTRMGSYTFGEIGHRTGLYGLVVPVLSTLRGQEEP
jgi:hypothetical protein